jgi:cytochrome oxidase Cu insertion factor (SCO1/SenC/PrrC family)
MMKTFSRSAALVVTGAVLLSGGCAARSDFTLTTLEGSKVTLSEQKGKVVLLAFFSAG